MWIFHVLASAAALSQTPPTLLANPSPIPTPKELQPTGVPGLPPILPKLAKKICALEYVDMAELLPEAWRQEADRGESCCHTPRPSRGLITDVTVWAECYATMAALLASHYPGKAPHLLAYLRTKVGRYTGILLVDDKFQKPFSYCGCYSLYRYIEYRGSGYSRYAIINFRY